MRSPTYRHTRSPPGACRAGQSRQIAAQAPSPATARCRTSLRRAASPSRRRTGAPCCERPSPCRLTTSRCRTAGPASRGRSCAWASCEISFANVLLGVTAGPKVIAWRRLLDVVSDRLTPQDGSPAGDLDLRSQENRLPCGVQGLLDSRLDVLGDQLAYLVALQIARGRPGQLGDEDHGPRALEVGHPL